MKLSLQAKLCMGICLVIVLGFCSMQSLILLDLINASHDTTLIGFFCLVFFIPFALRVLSEIWITQKEKQRLFNDKYKAINTSSMVVVFDHKGNIIESNENFCFAMGYKSFELIGKHHKELCDREYANSEEYIQFWSDLRKGAFIDGVFLRKTKENKNIWIRATYSPIKSEDGCVYQVIKIAHDITENVLSELELKTKNTYLEHAAKILRHDMHSGINTYIPRGLKSLERRLDEDKIKELKIQAPLKLLKEGLAHSQRVYKGVYEFTNLVRGDVEIELQHHKLDLILREHLSQTSYSDQVAIDNLPTIRVNQALFCTAIDNLIRNGLKYNDSDFKMVAVTMVDDDHLAVIDNGRGMSQKDFERLSQPYQRNPNQKESGTGLGLNICVAILKEHNFSVSVQEQEQGTMMKIKIR
jgi:PAS domain S-box-containing protein